MLRSILVGMLFLGACSSEAQVPNLDTQVSRRAYAQSWVENNVSTVCLDDMAYWAVPAYGGYTLVQKWQWETDTEDATPVRCSNTE